MANPPREIRTPGYSQRSEEGGISRFRGDHGNAERARLLEVPSGRSPWRRWGPYLSERAWGTVREDYSAGGAAWESFPHDHARSRAYRWSDDGLAGICDDRQDLCLALAFWNGRDPIVKERIFGLTGHEGNHGEDAKEYWFYLDSTPTHSWMRWRYLYPQAEFPYARLVEENARRGRLDPEYELADTGVFDENRYWEITADYAKADPEDILLRVTIRNAGPDEAAIDVLPTLWFRNTWSWTEGAERPLIVADRGSLLAQHQDLGHRVLALCGDPELLFCENESNAERLWNVPGSTPYPKDGINDHVVHGVATVNPELRGTRAAARYHLTVAAGARVEVRLRLSQTHPTKAAPPGIPGGAWRVEPRDFVGTPGTHPMKSAPNHRDFMGTPGTQGTAAGDLGAEFDELMRLRQEEADEFYAALTPADATADEALVMRQAFAGMLWSKQFFHYDVLTWLRGDPAQPAPPAERLHGRNAGWTHHDSRDVISMPDKWEYPWYAAWDLAFHCTTLAYVDPEFAKWQLVVLCREWFMHPNGQLPAYEWAFGDVNPPVHAWAALRVFHIDGSRDYAFLERVFHKLLINFTWWVNRTDSEGNNVFQGGFLGLDNVGPFNRGAALPFAGHMEQSDGTAWMAMYCLSMLEVALHLADHDDTYEDVALKFFEHFALIALASHQQGLWDELDGFFYDQLRFADGRTEALRARSCVGLIPLLAVTVLPAAVRARLPDFSRRMDFYLEDRPEVRELVRHVHVPGEEDSFLLSVMTPGQLRRVLARMLDPDEFLSPHGIRSLSRYHRDHPLLLDLGGGTAVLDYEPAESTTALLGGNSNWRGPIWFPINYLLVQALRRFQLYLGDRFEVECPTGSGQMRTLAEVSDELASRLIATFVNDGCGRRPVLGDRELFQGDPAWHDLIPFHEYFHGDTGAGLGASHQTGWTGLVANLLVERGRRRATVEPETGQLSD